MISLDFRKKMANQSTQYIWGCQANCNMLLSYSRLDMTLVQNWINWLIQSQCIINNNRIQVINNVETEFITTPNINNNSIDNEVVIWNNISLIITDLLIQYDNYPIGYLQTIVPFQFQIGHNNETYILNHLPILIANPIINNLNYTFNNFCFYCNNDHTGGWIFIPSFQRWCHKTCCQ